VVRVVLDTNVYISALLSPSGAPGKVVRRAVQQEGLLGVVSRPILEELRRALAYPRVRRLLHASDIELDRWLLALELTSDVVEGTTAVRAVADDPDDDKFLAAALEGRAPFVVSGDHHLLALGTYEEVRIVTPRDFLTILARAS